ncbi:hypothetical protein N7533_012890 [Penicillium manginii]|uniref:uncharacterized protein n=1 Tax=Penicillium manginii TaxID=203109 RepID=UPI002546C663|nr:uncharacterized protein N7533_012890 [Penicillium manginii]KAJ5740106.1 hypothetical protein N7533_012890 [Penicillium manginii]
MYFAIPAFITGALIRTSLGGVLQVIDEDRVCKIYSNNVDGCTGYSVSFSKLNGEDCLDISVAVNGTYIDFSYLDVAVCGQVNGKNIAWIRVNETGEVTFFNQNGVKVKCRLDNGLSTGSSCSVPDFYPLAVSSVNMPSSPATPRTLTAESGSSLTMTSDSISTTKSDLSLADTAGSVTATDSDSSLATSAGSTTSTMSDASGSSYTV